MKKILVWIVVLALFVSMTGCGSFVKIPEVNIEEPKEELSLFPADAYPIYQALYEIMNKEKAVNLKLPLVKGTESAFEFEGYPFTGKAQIYLDKSVGYSFSSISALKKANPLASVDWLVKNNVLNKSRTFEGEEYKFNFNSSSIATAVPRNINEGLNGIEKGNYPYTLEGAKKLVSDLDYYNNLNFDNEEYRNYSVNSLSLRWEDKEPQLIDVDYSKEDDCYYGYSITYSPFYSVCAAIYLKSQDKLTIDEAEIQLMDISYPAGNFAAGGSMSFSATADNVKFEFVSLYTCLEKILTGDFRAKELVGVKLYETDTYNTPLSYTMAEGKATLTLSSYYVNKEFYGKILGNEFEDGDVFNVFTYKIKL